MWGGLPADLRCIGGSSNTCKYFDIHTCAVFHHQYKLEVAIWPLGVVATENPINKMKNLFGFQSHQHLQGYMVTFIFNWWTKSPHIWILEYLHVWVEPPTYLRSAGRPHIKLFTPTIVGSEAVRGWVIMTITLFFNGLVDSNEICSYTYNHKTNVLVE